MARPQKCGMDYFPHDTDALTDEKIEALRMLYGNDGYAFYFILLERIYRTEHFELDISDAETIQILSRKIGVDINKFNLMLATAIKRNCFDNEAYKERCVLTSIGIKKRAEVVVTKRLSAKKAYNTRVSVAEITQETMSESTQSRVENSRVENSKEEDIKVLKFSCVPSVLSYYETLGLPNILKVSDTRKKLIEAREKEHGIDSVYQVLDAWSKSDFLTGARGDWSATIDWIFKSSNFIKVLEGNYVNKGPKDDFKKKMDNMKGWEL